MPNNIDLGNKLKKLRLDHQLSQSLLAEKLFVSRQAISLWETGKTIPDLTMLKKICEFYNISFDDLLDLNMRTSIDESFKLENFLKTLLFIVFTCLIPFLGCVTSVIILIQQIKNKKYSIITFLFCIIGFFICLFNSTVLIRYYF